MTSKGWRRAEQGLALLMVFLVAARVKLGSGLTAGDFAAAALAPLWLSMLRRYRGAWPVVLLGLLACASSTILTQAAGVDHHVDMKMNNRLVAGIARLSTTVGVLLWARERIRTRSIFVAFGLGMLAAGPDNMKLFTEDPWKFYLSVPLTIIVVGAVASERRPRLTIGALLAFAAACTVTDARSNLSVLMLTLVLISWRLLPGVHSRRSTIFGTLFTLAGVGVAAYYAIQAAILEGVLGETTRERSLEQLRTAGSLLLGGRPELGASMALFRHRPMGFGGGTHVSMGDLMAAKNGMASLHYDPDNGYVENFMFGRGIELHSTFFDLWAWCGLVGVVLALVVAALVLVTLGSQLNDAALSGAVTIFCAVLTLWNLPFSPYLTSMPILALVLGTGLVRKKGLSIPPPPRRAT